MTSLYSPPASLNHEMDLPSGLQAGSRSALPDALVRLRASPFSAGTVKISPRASTAARLPVGDSASDDTRVVTSFHCGIIHGKAPLAVMETMRSLPAAGSSSCT